MPSRETSVTALVSTSNPTPGLRHVVGDDQIDVLAFELLARMSDDVVRFGGKANQQRSCLSHARRQLAEVAEDVPRPRQREHQRPVAAWQSSAHLARAMV